MRPGKPSLVLLAAAAALALPGLAQAQGQGFFGGQDGFQERNRGGFQDGGRSTSPARAQMQACTNRVLAGLVRAKAPEDRAAPAVLKGCRAPLRAAVADAIRTGEAFICSNVEACMPMAQERAASEARDLYRRMMQR